jgi:RHS repeat-associated protein
MPHPPATHRSWQALWCGLLLSFLLLTDALVGWSGSVPTAWAAPLPDPASAQTTLDDLTALGNPDQRDPGTFVRPTDEPGVPSSGTTEITSEQLLPSAEPATMEGQAYTLDASFVVNAPTPTTSSATTTKAKRSPDGLKPAAIPAGQTALHITGSDQRLELEMPRSTLNLAKMALDDGSAPVGSLSLHLRQNHGNYRSANSLLGSYEIEIKDSQDHLVQGVQLTQPITIRYHYTAHEFAVLNLSPDNIQLSWPESVATAQKNQQPTAPFVTAMTNDPETQTLTAQMTTLGVGALVASGPPALELMPKPLGLSTSGNSGQLAYSYPIQVAPGLNGFAPELALAYNSQSLNERHSARAPGNAMGDGWSLSMGSITAQEYSRTDGSTANGTSYFLSGVAGVSERLIPDTVANQFVTQHISHLRIRKTGDCWQVWDRSGTYYELGCSTDAQQYGYDASGAKKVYRWDLSKVLPASLASGQNRRMMISYLQDIARDTQGRDVVRDAAIKQIRYGYDAPGGDALFDTIVGTVTFHYHAPTAQSPWADAYGTNYKGCTWMDNQSTTLRCDDPLTMGSVKSPDVMSTMTLDSVTSYVGKDDSSGKPLAKYDFTYQDTPGAHCWLYPLIEQYCAGEHALTAITPTIYQNGTANKRKGIVFGYTAGLQVMVRDPAHTFPGDANQIYNVQTFWRYLNKYRDLDTGAGAVVTYELAYANTHGTPYIKDSSGKVIDDRRNPLYCTHHANDSDTSKRCTAWPEDLVWTTQVVTKIDEQSLDSSDPNLKHAVTTYAYSLATFDEPRQVPDNWPWVCNRVPTSNPDVADNPFLGKCVTDAWSPSYDGTSNPAPDSNWVSFYDQEFRGFAAVYTTSPSDNLHAQYYAATAGMWTDSPDFFNYAAGQLLRDEYYQGATPDPTRLIQETINTYAGQIYTNTCDGRLAPVYVPCANRVLKSRTLVHETGRNSTTPWVEHQYTYDDYDANGYNPSGYGNLLEERVYGSNIPGNPTTTKRWTYQITDVDSDTSNYYTVDKPSSSQVIDNTGHIWQCQEMLYDEGRPGGVPAPNGGLVTTTTTSSDCNSSAKASTALKSFTGYDVYGNVVATVDPFGAANAVAYDSGNSETFGQHGSNHLWGYAANGDLAVGELRSQIVTLGGSGQVDFLLAGGNNASTLYVALVRASDNTVLFSATGLSTETYRRVTWDASAALGTAVYLKVVDNATGGWGHLNLDDVHIAGATLTNPDFELGNLSGWTVVSGTAFSDKAVTKQTTATNGGAGCQLATIPTYLSASWNATNHNLTSCTFYDSNHFNAVLPYQQTNVLDQQTSTVYNPGQGYLPTSATDANGQQTTTSYSYSLSADGKTSTVTMQIKQPGETGSYTTQSRAVSTCQDFDALTCYVVESNSALYPNAITRTYYDRKGREVEKRTPLDATHDLVSFTVFDDAKNTKFESVPFRYPTGSTWIDPYTAKIDNGTQAPAGTITVSDPLGRVWAVKDPALGSAAEPGITCDHLSGTWTSCTGYVGQATSADGTATLYHATWTVNANNQMSASLQDVLGRERSTQWYSQRGSLTDHLVSVRETQYNALDKPTQVRVRDLAPQPGQSTTTVITTASYDDLGRLTSATDPDRGTLTATYDADGRQILSVSGTRTIGTSYDLLGRVGCVQDAAPLTNGSGVCSDGSHPLVQNTYDVSTLGNAGSTDFPVGRQTRALATTYYPDGSSVSTTQQSQYDRRGQTITGTLQISLPASWNTTLPTDTMTQAYNAAGQLTTTQTTAGTQPGSLFTQVYDGATGTLIGLSRTSEGVANLVSQSFNPYGKTDAVHYLAPTGETVATASFTYDGNLRPAATTATWEAGSGNSGTIFQSANVFDPIGNVIAQSTTHGQVTGTSGSGGKETQNFCYDEQNRLIWASNTATPPAAGNGTCGAQTPGTTFTGAGSSTTTSYAYTHLGQLWQAPLNGSGSAQQYLYCDSAHPHQLTGVYSAGTTCDNRDGATASYATSYDAWGNVTSRTFNAITASLSYTVLDQLTRWDAGSNGQEWYAYDASGQRVAQRTIKGGVTSLKTYAFGIEEHVYDAAGTNTSTTSYFSLGGRLVGQRDGTTDRAILTDALGSVEAMFDTVAGKAVLLGNQLYGPYGNKRYQAGTISTSKGYTGQREDAATGLDYYNARYYDPVVGQFVSADIKEGNAQGLDPYAYVQGNPETLSDPSGYSGMVSGGFQHRPPSGGVVSGGFEHSSGGGNVPVPTPVVVKPNGVSGKNHYSTPVPVPVPAPTAVPNPTQVPTENGGNGEGNTPSPVIAAGLSSGLIQLAVNLVQNNKRLREDFSARYWAFLRAVRGKDIVNDDSGGVYTDRWYFTFDDGEGSEVVLSLNLNPNAGTGSDPWDMKRVHFSSDQVDPEKWGETGWARGDWFDAGASENPGDESEMSDFAKAMYAIEEVIEEDPLIVESLEE